MKTRYPAPQFVGLHVYNGWDFTWDEVISRG
jgi:hypothetical protein